MCITQEYFVVKALTVVVLLSSLVSGCGTKTDTITGTFTLIDSGITRNYMGCIGTGGYRDIQAGLKVVVKSGSGRILGVSELKPDNYSGTSRSVVCEFPFEVTDLPSSKFYSIEVGRRGSLEFSKKELEERDWKVGFKL